MHSGVSFQLNKSIFIDGHLKKNILTYEQNKLLPGIIIDRMIAWLDEDVRQENITKKINKDNCLEFTGFFDANVSGNLTENAFPKYC